MSKVKRILHQSDLIEVAKELGVRHDWHEPDEQGLTVRVFGKNFDNAGHWGLEHLSRRELEARTRLLESEKDSRQRRDRFRSRAVALCKDKAAEWQAQYQADVTGDHDDKVYYARAASEIASALEKL